MIHMLHTAGFKNVEMFKSGTERYPSCLVQANIDILSSRLDDTPFLLIEDDVDITQWFDITKPLYIPSNTDAMYVGFSKYGGSKTINLYEGQSEISRISNSFIKIHNMLGTHAILYVSRRYKQSVIDELNKILDQPDYNSDVIISRIHNNYNIYGYHYPLFYQNAALGGAQDATYFRYIIKPQPTIVTAYYPIKSKQPIEKYREWYSNFFKCVTADVICFCPPEMVDEFKEIARPNHQIIGRAFSSFEMMSETQMNVWRNLNKTDAEVSIGHTPELYAIWAAKQEFVRESMKLVDSDIFVWCDIGCFRDIRDGSFTSIDRFVIPSKITCLYLPFHCTFGGGVLAGDKNAWNTFSQNYLKNLELNPHWRDQTIFNRILNNNNANIITKESNGDDESWFFLTYLFSGISFP